MYQQTYNLYSFIFKLNNIQNKELFSVLGGGEGINKSKH